MRKIGDKVICQVSPEGSIKNASHLDEEHEFIIVGVRGTEEDYSKVDYLLLKLGIDFNTQDSIKLTNGKANGTYQNYSILTQAIDSWVLECNETSVISGVSNDKVVFSIPPTQLSPKELELCATIDLLEKELLSLKKSNILLSGKINYLEKELEPHSFATTKEDEPSSIFYATTPFKTKLF